MLIKRTDRQARRGTLAGALQSDADGGLDRRAFLRRSGLDANSHDGKALQHILESFPHDELFQSTVAELSRIATGIFGLQDRPRVRVLLRRDPFHRFYSCLVFVPREKYNTQVRQRIERAADVRIGEQAKAERELVADVEHRLHEDHLPIVIEAPVIDVPKSERVVKERQKPLFSELADTKLPQVDLLDAAPGRVETVTPETLEQAIELLAEKRASAPAKKKAPARRAATKPKAAAKK